MEKRAIGNSGLNVYPLALGGNVFGWTIDEAASFAVLDAFVDGGFNLIDTADMYSVWVSGHKGGESETVIGKWLKRSGNRDKVVIATKVGMELAKDKKGLKKDYILRAVEDSLSRLGTDYIDLYQSHTDDASTPLHETLEAYADLLDSGKIRAIGASNYTASRLEESLEVSKEYRLPRYECLQPQYNLYDRADYERDLEKTCRENNLGVIPYYSLASGFLTGKYRSKADAGKSARGGGVVSKYLNERGLRIIEALVTVADQYHCEPASVALAWLIARPGITAPIASVTSAKQVKTLIDGAQLVLDGASLELLDKASAYDGVQRMAG